MFFAILSKILFTKAYPICSPKFLDNINASFIITLYGIFLQYTSSNVEILIINNSMVLIEFKLIYVNFFINLIIFFSLLLISINNCCKYILSIFFLFGFFVLNFYEFDKLFFDISTL